jgi:hypothetical protein
VSPGFRTALVVLFLLACFMLGIWWEVSIWRECRTDHSVRYCLRLISR